MIHLEILEALFDLLVGDCEIESTINTLCDRYGEDAVSEAVLGAVA
jgi:hypothetical protein